MKTHKFIVVLVAVSAVLTLGACDIFGPKPTIEVPAYLSAATGPEAVSLTWKAVNGADSYTLYYTSDGTAPTKESEKIENILTSAYTHEGLDPKKSYTYAVAAELDSRLSKLSALSSPTMPNPVLHLKVTFDDYAEQQAVARLLIMEKDDEGNTVSGTVEIVKETPVVTNASGYVEFDLELSRDTYHGYTVYQDKDETGTMTNGDEVWGTDGDTGYYTYRSWSDYLTDSLTVTVDSWDTHSTMGHSTYSD